MYLSNKITIKTYNIENKFQWETMFGIWYKMVFPKKRIILQDELSREENILEFLWVREDSRYIMIWYNCHADYSSRLNNRGSCFNIAYKL